MITLFHLVELAALGVLLWRVWTPQVIKEVTVQPERPKTHKPVTFQLQDGRGNIEREVTVHTESVPTHYLYGDTGYVHLYKRKDGCHVYRRG